MTQEEEKVVINIAELRRYIGLTQAELAFELGISASTVARWEVYKNRPQPRYEKLLTDLLVRRGIEEKMVREAIFENWGKKNG